MNLSLREIPLRLRALIYAHHEHGVLFRFDQLYFFDINLSFSEAALLSVLNMFNLLKRIYGACYHRMDKTNWV